MKRVYASNSGGDAGTGPGRVYPVDTRLGEIRHVPIPPVEPVEPEPVGRNK